MQKKQVFYLTPQPENQCRVYKSKKPQNSELTESCGLVLSPNYPGLVPAGEWTWIITGPRMSYITFHLGTVTAPGKGHCATNYFEGK